MARARVYSASQFELQEELGRGAFGVVYRARDNIAGFDVAVKQVDLESSDEINEIQQEIKILSSCNNSHVTKYYGCFLKGFKLWIIMEFLGGGSCADLLTAGPFSEQVIGLIMYQLLQALVYLHGNGKIHRDFKAANALVSEAGDVKICDFGVATQLSSNMSKRNTFVGTPYWMPPEIIKHKEYRHSADMWSLGITAIELAYGKPPLSEFHPFDVLFKIADDDPPTLGSNFSGEFNDFVNQCLQRDPKLRPEAAALLDHPFIKKGSKVPRKEIVKLIEKKIQWDLETGNNIKKYYTPTKRVNITDNQQNILSPQFDFGTATENIRTSGKEYLTNDPITLKLVKVPNSPERKPLSQSSTPVSNTSTTDRDPKLRRDLNRILNQSFSKVSEHYNLSTSQYDSLVNFQSNFMDSMLSSSDEQYKEIFNKFIKLILKKVMKSENQNLKEFVLPRYFLHLENEFNAIKAKNEVKPRPRDDIEELLLTRWAEGILDKLNGDNLS